jgi:murein DD-endopeptidase MepM/ murein hydrolase activator NlpD
LVFILLLGGVLILAAYLPQEKQLAPREKPVIDLICRALQPGETVMVLLRGVTDIRQAEIKFLNQKYHLLPHPKAHQWFGLLGLDYRLKPGEYPLRAVIVDSQGNRQEVWLSLRVKPKSFPVKKLWVAPRYVTPPPEERERIRRESTLLQTIFSLETPSWLGQGRFILPCQGKVYLNFGEKRIYNNQPRSSHSGIDIAAVTGTPVVASNAGRVVLASNLYFAGKTVIIDHGLGLYTFYAHLAEIKVVRGDFVRQGQIIGLVGATGRVTGPHLHWSARLKGSRVDPMSLLEIPLGE